MARQPLQLKQRYKWSLFIVVLAVDLLLTLTLFVLYTSSRIRMTSNYSTAQLEQACASLDILYESLRSKVDQIMVDRDTITFLYASGTDRLQEASVGIKLRTLRTSDPYLRHITLYNSTSLRFVSTSCAGDILEPDLAEFFQLVDNTPGSYSCLLRRVGAAYTTQPAKDALTYTFIFPIQLQGSRATNLVVIDVNDSYFNSTLAPVRTNSGEQQILFTHQGNHVVSSLTARPGQQRFSISSETTLLDQLPDKKTEGAGYFTYQGQDMRRFVTYAWAPKAGWTIYNIMPYSTLLEGIASAMALTFILTLGTLAFGYVLSRRVSSSLYEPIKTLYENYVSRAPGQHTGTELEQLGQAFSDLYQKADSLEKGLLASYHESKSMYLRYLFHGDERRVQSSLATYQRLGIDLAAPAYQVILMECVPQRPDVEASLFICYYALENITRELLATPRGMEFMRMDDNRFAVLLYLDDPQLTPDLQQGLDTISETMGREFALDTTICVGDVANAWENINLDYEQTRIALDSYSASHYGKVFRSCDSPGRMNSELYFNSIHSKLAEQVRAGNLEDCAKEFDAALGAMRGISFKTAKTYTRHVLMSVLDDFPGFFDGNERDFAGLMEQLGQIDHCQNVQSMKAVFLEFLNSVSLRLTANRKNSNEEAALRAKEYIDRNYADPDLSMRLLAENTGLSPSYLGRVFTAVTAYTFNDYLTNTRLAQAAQLLCTTDLAVSKISEQVGILNTNYFYSLFKKRYGRTPTAYRKENKPEK